MTAIPAQPWAERDDDDDSRLVAEAAYVLGGNDLGTMTSAAPELYPHVWSWDAAFIALGLAKMSVPRAISELEALLRAQWRTGMLPHIVFTPDAPYYSPGPNWWRSSKVSPDAPRTPQTSGIIQPPVHAIAVMRIVAAARAAGGASEAAANAFLDRHWSALVAWHRYLADCRDPEQTGLLSIYHGWESGMDNSPRWDEPYSRVVPGADLPGYRRSDKAVIRDATQRPTDRDYDRYLWLVLQLRNAKYRDDVIRRTVDFHCADTFMSAIFAAANDALAEVAEATGRPEVAELREYADRFRAGVLSTVDASGFAADRDLRAGVELRTPSASGFAPLLCGGLPPDRQAALLALFDSTDWCGHPRLRYPVPPSTSPTTSAFTSRMYWRGPQWPMLSWLFGWALERLGEKDRAARLRDSTLAQVSEGSFAEYYEPFTGEPLGSMRQSWTAAVVLDWLL
jgi:glucosylglycerate hydrolase